MKFFYTNLKFGEGLPNDFTDPEVVEACLLVPDVKMTIFHLNEIFVENDSCKIVTKNGNVWLSTKLISKFVIEKDYNMYLFTYIPAFFFNQS